VGHGVVAVHLLPLLGLEAQAHVLGLVHHFWGVGPVVDLLGLGDLEGGGDCVVGTGSLGHLSCVWHWHFVT